MVTGWVQDKETAPPPLVKLMGTAVNPPGALGTPNVVTLGGLGSIGALPEVERAVKILMGQLLLSLVAVPVIVRMMASLMAMGEPTVKLTVMVPGAEVPEGLLVTTAEEPGCPEMGLAMGELKLQSGPPTKLGGIW